MLFNLFFILFLNQINFNNNNNYFYIYILKLIHYFQQEIIIIKILIDIGKLYISLNKYNSN